MIIHWAIITIIICVVLSSEVTMINKVQILWRAQRQRRQTFLGEQANSLGRNVHAILNADLKGESRGASCRE